MGGEVGTVAGVNTFGPQPGSRAQTQVRKIGFRKPRRVQQAVA